jgi:deoxyribodipyrimidine photo-lyase
VLVTDRAYEQTPKAWRAGVASSVACPMVQVESDVVVPVERASPKQEMSAANLRRKITPLLDTFLLPVEQQTLARPSVGMPLAERLPDVMVADDATAMLDSLPNLDRYVINPQDLYTYPSREALSAELRAREGA